MDGVQKQLTPTLQSPTVLYYAWDHLGTIRLITNDDLSIQERHDYEPYGLELPPYVNQSANTHQFTGHERDLTSGFDYMHFRYFGSTMGRFCKPDNVNGKLANPQSWNKYSYVVGNPVNFNDPTGHKWGIPCRPLHGSGALRGPNVGALPDDDPLKEYGAENMSPPKDDLPSERYDHDGVGASGNNTAYLEGRRLESNWSQWNTRASYFGLQYNVTNVTYETIPAGNFTVNGITYKTGEGIAVKANGYWTYSPPNGSSDVIPPPEGEAELRSLLKNWLQGKSYLDLNFSVGYWVGGTIGIQFNGKGAHLYVGGGFVTPGASGSLTWSPSAITPGWGIAGQGDAIVAYQYGYAKGGKYEEMGVGFPLGVTIAPYYLYSGSLW